MTPHADAILKLADEQRDPFTQQGVGGRLFSFDLIGFIGHCKAHGIPIGHEELSFILARLDMGSLEASVIVPHKVALFMAEVADHFSPRSLLDPWADLGDLVCLMQQRLHLARCDGYTPRRKGYDVFQLLTEASKVNLSLGEPLTLLQATAVSYDAVVGCPPFGINAQRSLDIVVDEQAQQIKDDYGFILVLEACRHLTEKGVGIFVLPSSFFFRPSEARHALARLGIRVVAAVELPAGTFRPSTSISTHVVLLQRSTNQHLFTARFADDAKHQADLLRNLRDGKAGKAPQLGRLVRADTFRGFTAVELTERIKEQARRMGLVPYPFGEVVLECHSPTSQVLLDGFEEKPNVVYLPQMAATAATTTETELPDKTNYLQLVINTEVANAEFVARLLNTSFGQLWRDSLRDDDTIPCISKALLQSSTIYLPPKSARAMQDEVLKCHHTVSRLRNELNELEAQLWRRPADLPTVQAALRTVNQHDRFNVWLDSLPFPLASVLWVCRTQAGSLKEQYERKLHFFEALAEFMGVVYLSAYSAHQAMWNEWRNTLLEALEKGKLSLEMATFGTWKAVVEVFSAQTRQLLERDDALAFELFKTRNRQVLETLCSKDIVSILQATNKTRNERIGHTGIVADAVAKAVNDGLEAHTETVRRVFGVMWDEYELLLPGECKMRSSVYHYTYTKVMGTRTPFATDTVQVVEPMEDGHLHLKSPAERRALKLLPFVKVMRSPKTAENACYFYNRRQADGIRFLSYYFEPDAEVVEEFGDVAKVLGDLVPTTDR
jgi:N-6 DNA Methylase